MNELQIKIALIKWLFDRGQLIDATIINEMVVANWSRRADLVIVNGKIQAFEIKSDLDTLTRLDGQLAIFTSRFDKVTVVCSSRFTYEVKSKVSSNVGIIEFENQEKNISFKIIQRGKTEEIRNKKFLLNYLTKAELANLLKENNVFRIDGCSRKDMEMQAENLSVKKVRNNILLNLKNRYKETSDSFVSTLPLKKELNVNDLQLLRKKKQLIKSNVSTLDTGNIETYSDEHLYDIDVLRMQKKYGVDNIPTDLPLHVLKRAKPRR